MIIGLAWRYYNDSILEKKLSLEYDLAKDKEQLKIYSTQLEDLVAEKTKELSVSEQRFRELFDNANDGIAVMDKNGLIINVNHKFCQLHGFAKDAIIGTHFGLLEAKDHNSVEGRLKRILDGEVLIYETEHYRKDGSKVLLEISSKAIKIGREIFIQSFHRDIADKKQLQEQLLQSQKMESIGLLAGGIAHDFRNILTAILGHVGLLQDSDTLDNKSRQSLRIIENSSRKAGQIISKLLSFSRKSSFEMLPLNINDIVKDTVELCKTTAIKRNVDIRITTANNIPPINADANYIEQVLMNLFMNAMDAMPGGGVITTTTALMDLGKDASRVHPLLTPGYYVLIKISDTGTGIPDEIKDKIFNPFFSTKGDKGTGLGLSMVYGTIKEHQGVINVKSTVNKGTTFEIYLPSPDTAISGVPEISAHQETASARILVIDDEEAVLNFIKETIENYGYRPIATYDPFYAIEIFGKFADNIDLIITDISMPLLDGRKLIKHLKAIKPDVKTIIISAHDADEVIKNSSTINGFLKKPFDDMQLISTIKKALGPNSSARNIS